MNSRLAAFSVMVVLIFVSGPLRSQVKEGATVDKSNRPEQVLGYDTCLQALSLGEQWSSFSENDLAYDTIRWYIMHCYLTADPGRTFNALQGCAGSASPLATAYGRSQYVNWLMDTVIKLRSDDGWFCCCVEALTPGYDHYASNMPAELAILKFIIDNPRCAGMRKGLGFAYASERQAQISLWGDTAKNNNMKNFDSSLPSMHDLGLDSLLNTASVHHYDATGPQIILDAHVTANPFETETSVSLSINREAYLHIEVLDLLGRKIEGAGYDGVFEPGNRVVPLKMSSLASGTYYVRISTANNELRTFKVEKKQ
jgi:hypothetical protein